MKRTQANEAYLPFDLFTVGLRERQLPGNIGYAFPGRLAIHGLDTVMPAVIILAARALNHGDTEIHRLPESQDVIDSGQQA